MVRFVNWTNGSNCPIDSWLSASPAYPWHRSWFRSPARFDVRDREGPLPEDEVRRFLAAADRALTYLHGCYPMSRVLRAWLATGASPREARAPRTSSETRSARCISPPENLAPRASPRARA